MPGTSMPSFQDLNENQRKLLVRDMLRLQREGIREQFINVLRDEGEEIDENEVRQVVEQCTTPAEVVPVPHIGRAESQAIARGKDAYFKLGCNNCHGDDGRGAWDTPLFDDKGRPSPPRDLVDLVHYCRPLSREPKRMLTNDQRAIQATSWGRLSAFQR